MAITIRNKETEDLIPKIGRRTGEGPSAVVRRLAENENRMQSEGQISEAEVARRLQVFEDLRRKYPPPDPKPTWTDIQAEVDSLYGYLDEPKASRDRAAHE